MDRVEVAKNINAAILASGISRKTLAAKLGIGEPAVSNIVRGKYCPKLWVAKGIANILGLSLDELIGAKPNRRLWDERTGSIGEHMREVRQSQYLSLEDLEDLADVSGRCIAYLELEKHEPQLATIILLAEALGMTPSEYIGDPPPAKMGRRSVM